MGFKRKKKEEKTYGKTQSRFTIMPFFHYFICVCLCVAVVHFIFVIILFIYLAVCARVCILLAIHFFFCLISANGFLFHFAFEIRVILLFREKKNEPNKVIKLIFFVIIF